jgi:hypothetical protein
MLIAAARRRVTALRQPVPAARIARALWIAWAVIVWNVVFDRVIVVAGRSYITAARRAADANPSGPLVDMDDWMRPAITRGLWLATASAGAILVTGLVTVHFAQRPADEQARLNGKRAKIKKASPASRSTSAF